MGKRPPAFGYEPDAVGSTAAAAAAAAISADNVRPKKRAKKKPPAQTLLSMGGGGVEVLARSHPCFCPGGASAIVRGGVRVCASQENKCPFRQSVANGDDEDDDDDEGAAFPMDERPLCECGLHCRVRRSRPDSDSPHAGRAYFACPQGGRRACARQFVGWCSDDDAPRGPDCRQCSRPAVAKRVRKADSPNAGKWFWTCNCECGFFAWHTAHGKHAQ